MKSLFAFVAAAGLVGVLGMAAMADDMAPPEVTLKGSIVCAKCTLKEKDQKACQNVLQVKDGDATTNYYLVKNDVYKSTGEVCHATVNATVTGTVEEKDGKKWLTATKIEAEKKS